VTRACLASPTPPPPLSLPFRSARTGGKKKSSSRPLCLPHPAGTLTLAAGAPPAAPYRWDGESSVLSLSLLYHSFLPSLSLLRGSRVTGGEGVAVRWGDGIRWPPGGLVWFGWAIWCGIHGVFFYWGSTCVWGDWLGELRAPLLGAFVFGEWIFELGRRLISGCYSSDSVR
jgi:hypothetical protein